MSRKSRRTTAVATKVALGTVALAIATTLPAAAAGYTVYWNGQTSYPGSYTRAYKTIDCSGGYVKLTNPPGKTSATGVQSIKSPDYYTEFTISGTNVTPIANGVCYRVRATGQVKGFDPAK